MMEKFVVICEYCSKEFSKIAYYNRHVKNIHIKKNSEVKCEIPFICEQCGKKYSTKSSMQRHINTVHLKDSENYYSCEKCNYKTVYRFHIKHHLLKVHSKDKVKNILGPYKCELCSAQYKQLNSLKYHERQNHQVGGPPSIIVKRKCPICSFIADGSKSEQDIHKHFQALHNINIQIKTLSFSCINSFYDWKKELENKSISYFTKRYSSLKRMIYRCHRCGIYKKRGIDKRKLKTIGSCKIDAFCPAMIKVMILNNQSVKVIYISKHIGHKLEPNHIPLKKIKREKIATDLTSKVLHYDITKSCPLSNNILKKINVINHFNVESEKYPLDPKNIEA